MTAIDFPSSPTDGQIFTSGDKTWTYSTTLTAWSLQTQTTTGPTGPTGAQGATGATGSAIIPSIGYQTNIYYSPLTATSTVSTEYQVTSYLPIFIFETHTFTRIWMRTNSAQSGSYNVRLGIYNNDSTTGKPSTVVLDAGTVVVTSPLTSYEIVISQSLTSGWYWLACNVESINTAGNIHINTVSISNIFGNVLSTANAALRDTGCWSESGITGAFATAGTLTAILHAKQMGLRA